MSNVLFTIRPFGTSNPVLFEARVLANLVSLTAHTPDERYHVTLNAKDSESFRANRIMCSKIIRYCIETYAIRLCVWYFRKIAETTSDFNVDVDTILRNFDESLIREPMPLEIETEQMYHFDFGDPRDRM